MIDMNAPGADNIFRASGHTGKIKAFCQAYIFRDFKDRQLTFDKMRNECTALLILSEKAFPDEFEKIEEEIGRIMDEIDRLAVIDEVTEAGKCTVCNGEIKRFHTRSSRPPYFISYCRSCPEKIGNLLEDVDELTGAAWI